MRIRDHVALSTGVATLLSPLLGRKVVYACLASILVDADHYLWFCAQQRSLNPLAAVRFFNQASPPQHHATRVLHHPAILLLLLSIRLRWAALGIALHLALDTYHEACLDRARAVALKRDHWHCQACGAAGPRIVAHLWYQPRLLPSYHAEYFISLCSDCHEAAHAVGGRLNPLGVMTSIRRDSALERAYG